MSFRVVERGTTFLNIQVLGVRGKKYDVEVNNIIQSDVDHGAILTFTGLDPETDYTVYLYVKPQEYFRVVIRNNAQKDPLNLAEVRVYDNDGVLVSRDPQKVTNVWQTSTTHDGVPFRAIDGNTDGKYNSSSVTHTAAGETAYWVLEFGRTTTIREIQIFNRTDDCCKSRLDGALLMLDNIDKQTVHKIELNGNVFQSFKFDP